MNGSRLLPGTLLRLGALALLFGATGVVGGCTSNSKQLDAAIGSYNAGRFQQAYDQARRARQSSSGAARFESAYVAGLSAIRIERPLTARTYLEEATRSRDPQVSGRAEVSLGTLLLEDGEPRQAAGAFDRAAGKLTGADRVRAKYRAGLAYRAAGDESAAEARLTNGAQALSPGRFTIQGGFFTDRLRAVRRAEQLSAEGRAWSIGPATVVPAEARGATGWAAQIGDFPTRTDAELTRRRLGDSKTFVTKIVAP